MTAVYAVALVCDEPGCPATYPHDTASAPTARAVAVADGWECARPDAALPRVDRHVRDYCPKHVQQPTPAQVAHLACAVEAHDEDMGAVPDTGSGDSEFTTPPGSSAPCSGDDRCLASPHWHGCFADDHADCDDPTAHDDTRSGDQRG